jgi:hypothetical protein
MSIPPFVRQYIVEPFLSEINSIKLRESVPLHVVCRRIALSRHVLDDCPGDDAEELALRGIADATVDLCWHPKDRPVIDRWLAARRGHLEVLQAVYDSQ